MKLIVVDWLEKGTIDTYPFAPLMPEPVVDWLEKGTIDTGSGAAAGGVPVVDWLEKGTIDTSRLVYFLTICWLGQNVKCKKALMPSK